MTKKSSVLVLVLFVVGTCGIVGVLFGCVVGAIYYSGMVKKNFVKGEKQVFKYQTLEYDSADGRTSLGMVSIFEELPEEGFISYENSEGKHTLVSEFGLEEYKCRGSCSCDDSRRTSTSALIKPVLYFVAALGSVVAYNLAEQHFEETCQMKMATECASESIQSNVDDCDCAESCVCDHVPADKCEDLKDGDSQFDYMCDGGCKPVVSVLNFADGLVENSQKSLFLDQTKVCKNMKMEGAEIAVVVRKGQPHGCSGEPSGVNCLEVAKAKFQRSLWKFCHIDSFFSIPDDGGALGELMKDYSSQKRFDQKGHNSWCTSEDEGVHCRIIEKIPLEMM